VSGALRKSGEQRELAPLQIEKSASDGGFVTADVDYDRTSFEDGALCLRLDDRGRSIECRQFADNLRAIALASPLIALTSCVGNDVPILDFPLPNLSRRRC